MGKHASDSGNVPNVLLQIRELYNFRQPKEMRVVINRNSGKQGVFANIPLKYILSVQDAFDTRY